MIHVFLKTYFLKLEIPQKSSYTFSKLYSTMRVQMKVDLFEIFEIFKIWLHSTTASMETARTFTLCNQSKYFSRYIADPRTHRKSCFYDFTNVFDQFLCKSKNMMPVLFSQTHTTQCTRETTNINAYTH